MGSTAHQETAEEMKAPVADFVSVNETFWGYIIRQGGNSKRNAGLGEAAAILGSIAFGILAYCQWLLPGTINSVEILPFKMAGTAVFFVGAGFLYMIARKGLLFEVQIDEKRGAVRTARRNREGESTLLEAYPFSDIADVYMKRAGLLSRSSRIFIQPGSRKQPIHVVKGPAEQLQPVLDSLIADLRPQDAHPVQDAVDGPEDKSDSAAFAAQ